jgi:uridylate kinase
VILKLSGEALAGGLGFGYCPDTVEGIALQLKMIVDMGVELGIVIGGGNIWRGGIGSGRLGIERANADYMGMLGTVMNGIALQGILERLGVTARVMSAIEMKPVCETYLRRRAIKHLSQKRVTIFVAGTGSPFFSTDTVAALRAAECNADLVIKATQVDGVYSADPKKDPNAKRFSRISYSEYLTLGLYALDAAAIALCRENAIPIIVLSLDKPENICLALSGNDIGTVIGG